MLIKPVTNHIYDVFTDNIGSAKTGWEPDLWVRVYVKNGRVDYVRGNRGLMKSISTVKFNY